MGRKVSPGLFKRGKYWHIEKRVFGLRLRESTGTELLSEAERYLARRVEEVRQASVYGVRPERTFKEAATKYLQENQHKRSLSSDIGRLKVLMNYIGDVPLTGIHMGTLQEFINERRKQGIKTRTINHGLVIVRRILNLAASEWLDEHNLTWLQSSPKIKLLPEHDLRKPHPLNWHEQESFFSLLPRHLRKMALFAVNTGCRDQEICKLRWDWERHYPQLPHVLVFVVPGRLVKNGDDRLVVCNNLAKAVVESCRGRHATHVFSYSGHPMSRMLTSAWCRARTKLNLDIRVHDLKHTYGRRLRAAGVSLEDRQDLLGHRSGKITTHYSAAELHNLYAASNKVCVQQRNREEATLLRGTQNFSKSDSSLLKLLEDKTTHELVNAHNIPTVI
jgi:integrase